MAIFSQNNKKTDIDYRNYDKDRPNRCIPFNLPEEIKEKLIQFLNYTYYNTGSFDLIVSDENEYYFLEINPIGQFGGLSYKCQYKIEEKIAKFLMTKNG